MSNIYNLLQSQANTNKQIYTVLRFACRCDHATAMLFQSFESVTAMIAAKCSSVNIYTLMNVDENFNKLYYPLAEEQEIKMSVNQISDVISPTELLYIDTPAEGNYRAMELSKYCNFVSKYIILPKTVQYGLQPANNITLENNKQPIGLNFGINHFLQTYDDWFILEHDDLDPGITVLVNRKNVANAYS